MKEQCKNCVSFKVEISEALFDLGKYDGQCLRKRKDRLVKKTSRCKLFDSGIPLTLPNSGDNIGCDSESYQGDTHGQW
jgi:hypothetical protein